MQAHKLSAWNDYRFTVTLQVTWVSNFESLRNTIDNPVIQWMYKLHATQMNSQVTGSPSFPLYESFQGHSIVWMSVCRVRAHIGYTGLTFTRFELIWPQKPPWSCRHPGLPGDGGSDSKGKLLNSAKQQACCWQFCSPHPFMFSMIICWIPHLCSLKPTESDCKSHALRSHDDNMGYR